MNFGSLCSGIEAASVAWHPLGWRTAFVSEIEPFPCALLAHHYPSVPNLGDMTGFKEWPDAALDVLVGGTPCQSFSVAGLRKGLDDPRGNLMLTYLAIAARYRPRWLVWENVPGVLSIDGGRAFAALLMGLAKLGYGFSYRVLDAQHFGVPQRRRRVFVVGCLGDWRRAAAVLFERASLRGDSPPHREARKTAPTIPSRSSAGGGLGTDFDCDGGLIPATVGALTDGAHNGGGLTGRTHIPAASLPSVSMCLNAGAMGRIDAESETLLPTGGCFDDVAHSLRGEGFDASEDGTGRGTPLVADTLRGHPRPGSNSLGAIAFAENSRAELRMEGGDGSRTGALSTGGGKPAQGVPMIATAFDARQSDMIQYGEKTGPLDTCGSTMGIQERAGVRRLTPRECERLQGFPDDYTAITVRGKPAADGPRYKALGNSMAVPVMRWIGERIAAVDAIK